MMRNIAVTDMYEPGSTFKIVAASGAINEGLVSPSTRFDCSLDHIDYKGRSRSLPARIIVRRSSIRSGHQNHQLLE